MHAIFFSLLASFGLIVSSSMNQFETICPHCSGFKIYGEQSVNQIQANENVRLIGTKVTGPTSVVGHLYSENAQLQQVNIDGKGTFISTQVLGKCIVEGELEAVDSTFKTIDVTGSKVIFNHCTIQSLYAKGQDEVQPVITLRKGTQIDSVFFQGREGIVYTDSKSNVHTIKNGKIVVNN